MSGASGGAASATVGFLHAMWLSGFPLHMGGFFGQLVIVNDLLSGG